jgi:hypothetical protein
MGVVAMAAALSAACGMDNSIPPYEGSGGAPGGGGAGTGAGTGGTTTVGSGGTQAGSGGRNTGTGGTQTGAGGTQAGSGGRNTGAGGNNAGTGGGIVTGAGGNNTGSGGAATGAGGSPTVVGSKEDDGTDCTIGTLPDSGSLSAITLLPNPFKKLDGTAVATKADWRCRREEIRKQGEKYAYGTKPPPPMTVSGTVSNTSIMVSVTDGGKTATFSATITLPASGSPPYPAIIGYGGVAPLDTSVLDAEGVAQITYNPLSVGAEGGGHSANQTGAFYSLYTGGSKTGLLIAWGWGVSRIIDVIEKSGSTIIKPDAIGVTGCSRYGKGAFIAGAFDQRVALTMPIESGTAGVPIWRGIAKADKGENGNPSQSLASAYSEQPWFADAFNAFTNAATKTPLDTHEVVGMIAPRGLFIMDNPHIGELSPKYGHVAAIAGAEIYKSLGAGDNISYISDVQSGTHCGARPEWKMPLQDNVRKFLKGTGNAPGVIKAPAAYTGNLSDWRDWTTPTLN